MRRSDRRARARAEAQAAELNVVPLVLAVWLGTMAAVAGLIRLAEQAPVNQIVTTDQPANFQ